MSLFYKKRARIAVGVLFLASVISTLVVGSTFAALSANIVWDSDTGTSGEFELTDSNYKLSLFGDKDIFPGEGAGSTLSGVDFSGCDVDWSFVETNNSFMPIVYYIKSPTGNLSGYYSKYNFASFSGLYVKLLNDNYIDTANISASPVALTAALEINCTINWVWPDALYTKDSDAYDLANAEAYSNLTDHNASLCTAVYRFSQVHADLINTFNNITGIVSSKNDNHCTIIPLNAQKLSLSNDKLMLNENPIPLLQNNIFTANVGMVSAGNCFGILIRTEDLSTFTAAANINKITYCDMGDVTYGENNYVRRLIYVYPQACFKCAEVSVSIMATATPKIN